MEETYTFSRALHLMRYGGRILRPEPEQSIKYRVKDGRLQHAWMMGNKHDTIWYDSDSIGSTRIMGSWVEVK